MQSNQEPPQRRDAYAAKAKETFGIGPVLSSAHGTRPFSKQKGLIGKTRVARKNQDSS
jgi:hypothetical protein